MASRSITAGFYGALEGIHDNGYPRFRLADDLAASMAISAIAPKAMKFT